MVRYGKLELTRSRQAALNAAEILTLVALLGWRRRILLERPVSRDSPLQLAAPSTILMHSYRPLLKHRRRLMTRLRPFRPPSGVTWASCVSAF